ncbi:toxin-antitoxin system HicB family antitoxin [Streptomyces sp. NPDC001743]|uniref:toxin-antitoxin system HicB family antitoxin n=1 Tax=Streptomyces sp. NPDC001743 TaxID=3154397 RepID=UPI00333188AA
MKSMTLRVPDEDAARISRRAADLGLSVNAYLHQTVMAEVNHDVDRFAAPTKAVLEWLEADAKAAEILGPLSAKIDRPPGAEREAAA